MLAEERVVVDTGDPCAHDRVARRKTFRSFISAIHSSSISPAVNDSADAGAEQELVIAHVRCVGEHLDVVHDRFVDRGPIDVFGQLDPAAALKVPGVHPDLEDLNTLGRLGPDGVSRFFR